MDQGALIGMVAQTNQVVMTAARHLLERWEEQERRRERRRTKTKAYWIHPIFLGREIHGHYDSLMSELMRSDVPGFKKFIRMEPELILEIS
jgi:hypothetical protein